MGQNKNCIGQIGRSNPLWDTLFVKVSLDQPTRIPIKRQFFYLIYGACHRLLASWDVHSGNLIKVFTDSPFKIKFSPCRFWAIDIAIDELYLLFQYFNVISMFWIAVRMHRFFCSQNIALHLVVNLTSLWSKHQP